MLDWVENSAGWLAAVGAGGTVAIMLFRWARKRARAFGRKWDNAREALVGREEILHPDTGAVLVPATPGLGSRLAMIEDGQRLIEQNLIVLSQTRAEMTDLSAAVSALGDQLGQHISEANDLEMARTKERGEMWHAIQAVATPTPWDGTERRSAKQEEGSNG